MILSLGSGSLGRCRSWPSVPSFVKTKVDVQWQAAEAAETADLAMVFHPVNRLRRPARGPDRRESGAVQGTGTSISPQALFPPQQVAEPTSVRAHVWTSPAATCVNIPIGASLFSPQHVMV